jgi:hypothetical protein
MDLFTADREPGWIAIRLRSICESGGAELENKGRAGPKTW